MKSRLLTIATACAMAFGAFAATPAAANVASAAGPLANVATAAGEQAKPADYRGRGRHWRGGRHYRGGPRWDRGRHWRGHRQFRPHRRAYRSCWRNQRIRTPYGYVVRRVYVCR